MACDAEGKIIENRADYKKYISPVEILELIRNNVAGHKLDLYNKNCMETHDNIN